MIFLGGRMRTALGCLVLATLVVTGCSERQEANTTLPTASAVETTPGALPQLGPPDMPMPSEAREQTAEGAQAFTEYYVEVYNHSLRALDTTYLRDLNQGCDTCDRLAEQVERIAERGEGFGGGEMRIVGSTPPYLHGEQADLVFDIAQAAISATMNGEPIEGRHYAASESSGGGGILHWDGTRKTWLFTQWNLQ